MWFMWFAGWLSTFILLVSATLCLACGLYYIAEIVEEYPQPTKQFISYALMECMLVFNMKCIHLYGFYNGKEVKNPVWTGRPIDTSSFVGAIALNIGMGLFEEFPLLVVAVGVGAHLIYMTLLPAFPNVEFSSLPFLGSIAAFVLHQYLVFDYFSREWHQFSDVLAYFILCIWLVPLTYFVSLSSTEENLPTACEEWSTGSAPRRGEKAWILSLFKFISRKREDLMPVVRPNSKNM